MVSTGERVDGRGTRRTQAERSAAMRQRLLEATVDSLVTHGYAGTTTQRVAELAGVTRGAQIHHFRAKVDLVTAAVEHLAQQRAKAVVREIGRIQQGSDRATAVLELLWQAHQGPFFIATLELWIAGRTDPALAHQIQRVEPVVNGALLAAIGQLVSERSERRALRDAAYTAMDALRGILVAGFVDGDQGRLRKRWERASAPLLRELNEAFAEEGGVPV